jgi:alpha-glucosidase
MYFHKIEHPYNFVFGDDHKDLLDGNIRFQGEDLGSDVFRVSAKGDGCRRWEIPPQETNLSVHQFKSSNSSGTFNVSAKGELILSFFGRELLKTRESTAFGLCGKKWIFCFNLTPENHFYGMGEKNIGFEKSGIRTKFWNTDVWGDFSDDDGLFGITDPMYISIPYMLIHTGDDAWVGVLIHNPYPVFMDTGARQVIEGVKDSGQDESYFYIGSTDGIPDIYVIAGKNPAEVTRKLQQLSGGVPRPPLWSLGYQQSRWGYGSAGDLEHLEEKLTELAIPCDGLWLDIDYMDGYKIFTFDNQKFPNPSETFKSITGRTGRKIVPILDPGIKREVTYAICKEGTEEDLFCLTSEGKPYVGFVWPGASHFPDFSLERVKTWWAARTKELVNLGISGFWIDMNDPSTGSAELDEMRFSDGTLSHESYHNQYANGMAKAVVNGLLAAEPEKRPFILTRSGFIGINGHAAVWTGDNHSNYHHLRMAVEMELSLSLSGVPFAGSDIGGFGCDAEPENFTDWHKTCFLFPFFRNHSADGSARQEPWAFDEEVLKTTREYIRSRYVFRPYLYNLFIELEKSGDPIIRPLLYEFDGYFEQASQFMVGSAVMQAPKMEKGKSTSIVNIPPGCWYEPWSGKWIEGTDDLKVSLAGEGTPIFFREGRIIPLSRFADIGDPLTEIDLFVCAGGSGDSSGSGYYECDGGEGFGYRKDYVTAVDMKYIYSDGVLKLTLMCRKSDYQPLNIRIMVPNMIKSASIEIRHSDGTEVNDVCVFEKGRLPLPGGCQNTQVSQLFKIV